MKTDLVNRLIKRYGYNEPIMVSEVSKMWSEYSRPRVFQLLKELTRDETIKRFDMGIYYVPIDTVIGKSSLDPSKVIEKRFIRSGNELYGYYTGLLLLNELGLTTQMPYTLEVVTTKETTRIRKVEVGKARVLLRRAKTPITKENVPVLQLLDMFKDTDELLEKYQIARISEFIKRGNIKIDDIYKYAPLYPKRTIENLFNSEVRYAFA
ncbi:MAG: DUF6088 family protein [Clostridiales bacterium]|jgi:predicted transcriptional regulator of viral defense system|nr:DUF6088 family protein [Clostridiales bacterium]